MKNVLQNPIVRKIILIIILIVSAFFIGRGSVSKKVEIKYKEKIKTVYKYKERLTEDTKKNVEVITKIIYKTDGTKIEERREIDKSEIKTEKLTKNSKKLEKKSQLDQKVEYNTNKVTFSAFSQIALNELLPPKSPVYGILIQRPIISSLNAGIGLSTDQKVLISIGISF